MRGVGHVFAYLYTLDDNSELPMDCETSLLSNVFFHSATEVANLCFIGKIEKIKHDLLSHQNGSSSEERRYTIDRLSEFESATEDEVHNIILTPPSQLYELDEILQLITFIVNLLLE